MARDPKTPEQITREIAYYQQQLKRTRSADRQQRCRSAIAKRERLLEQARKVQRRW
jgi:hypothetical protein